MALKVLIRRHWVNGLYAMALGAVASMTSFNFFHGTQLPPYTELKAEVLTPRIHTGEPVAIELSGTRNRLCTVFLSRGLVNTRNGRMVYQDFVPVGFSQLGPFKRPIEMRLPAYVGPGCYVLKSIQNNDCGQETYPIPYPDVAFCVVNQN